MTVSGQGGILGDVAPRRVGAMLAYKSSMFRDYQLALICHVSDSIQTLMTL